MFHEIHQDSAIARHARADEVKSLYSRYQTLATGLSPTLAGFGLARLAALLDDLMILAPAGDDFLYRHVGANIAELIGIDHTGQRTSQLAGEVGDFVRGCYREAATTGQPLHTLHYSNDGPEMHLWERLILPLADADGAPLIVVFSRPREFHRLLTDLLETLPSGLTGLREHEGHPAAA